MERKTCPHCGRTFVPASGRQEYCSKQCRIAAAGKKRLEAKAKESEVPDCVISDGPDDPAKEIQTADLSGTPDVDLTKKNPAEAAEPDIPAVPDVLKKTDPSWREPEPAPEDKNIRAVKKILKLIPINEPCTLKISLEAGSIQMSVTIVRDGPDNKNAG